MLPIEELGKMRRRLGMSQKELAARAGVSQSLIAKIESGRIRVSYDRVRRIFKVLEDRALEEYPKTRVKEISNKEIIGVSGADPVRKAAELMQKYDYSQLPVYDGDTSIGSISEKTINDYIAQGKDLEILPAMPIESLMEGAFPQVDEGASIDVVTGLLRYFPAVLTTKKGKITGIVTKADLLKIVRKR